MDTQHLLLLAEDEAELSKLVSKRLIHAGFEVVVVDDGAAVLSKAKELRPDLLLLDISMPNQSGYDVCRSIRSDESIKSLPIIFLTALAQNESELLGLELGGDDYIRKPFDHQILITRIRNIIKRHQSIDTQKLVNTHEDKLEYENIMMDKKAHKVYVDFKEVKLTELEYSLLEVFFENIGVALSREDLIESAWKHKVQIGHRAVDVHMRSIRKHLEPYSNFIQTIHGHGYRFEKPAVSSVEY